MKPIDACKAVASKFPPFFQHELRRIKILFQIKSNKFIEDEPEYNILNSIITPNDWVLDIGANVGRYTKKFSELVGPRGRVIALEPVPNTFSILAGSSHLYKYPNVTFLNLAASKTMTTFGVNIPYSNTGLKNFELANLITDDSTFQVLSVPIDHLNLPHKIKLIKMDVEGHELDALSGMTKLLIRDRPILIIETSSSEVFSLLHNIGYQNERMPDSPNVIFK